MGKQKQKQKPPEDLERREAAVAAREAALAKRAEAADAILEAADERDALADARDVAADQRERDLDLAELLAPPTSSGTATTGPNAAMPLSTGRSRRMTGPHRTRIGRP